MTPAPFHTQSGPERLRASAVPVPWRFVGVRCAYSPSRTMAYPRIRGRGAARRGIYVIHASNGEEALSWCGRRVADVLVTDIVLPGRIDGWRIAGSAGLSPTRCSGGRYLRSLLLRCCGRIRRAIYSSQRSSAIHCLARLGKVIRDDVDFVVIFAYAALALKRRNSGAPPDRFGWIAFAAGSFTRWPEAW